MRILIQERSQSQQMVESGFEVRLFSLSGPHLQHFLPLYIRFRRKSKKVKVLVTQSCLTLSNPMNCSLPGSSVSRILQARITEWVAISFSWGSSWQGTEPVIIIWVTREALNQEETMCKVSVALRSVITQPTYPKLHYVVFKVSGLWTLLILNSTL